MSLKPKTIQNSRSVSSIPLHCGSTGPSGSVCTHRAEPSCPELKSLPNLLLCNSPLLECVCVCVQEMEERWLSRVDYRPGCVVVKPQCKHQRNSMLFLSPGVRLYNKTCTHSLLSWSHSACLCARKVRWRVYVYKYVSWWIYLMSVHTHKISMVFASMLWFDQQNILLHWHSLQWLVYVCIFVLQLLNQHQVIITFNDIKIHLKRIYTVLTVLHRKCSLLHLVFTEQFWPVSYAVQLLFVFWNHYLCNVQYKVTRFPI